MSINKLYTLFYYTSVAVTVGLSLFIGLLWNYQERLIFLPEIDRYPRDNPKGLRHPGESEMDYENVYATTSDGVKVHMWFIKQPAEIRKEVPTVLYFQSQSSNMGFCLPRMKLIYKTCRANILMLSYRGYGYSEGKPSEKGLYLDMKEASNFLNKREDINKSKIYVYGSSLGTGVAVEAAHTYPNLFCGLILENPFVDLYGVAKYQFPILKYVIFGKRLLRTLMDNESKLRHIHTPLLLFTATEDTVVPPGQASALLNACPSLLKKRINAPCDHNDIWCTIDVAKEVNKFIQINETFP